MFWLFFSTAAALLSFCCILLRRFYRNCATPISVNYHISRKCNYKCGFCFHTDLNSYILPIEQAKLGLKLLKKAGMQKINFAGGEPFLYPKLLGELVKYSKVELNLNTSIISNGSLIKESWLRSYGGYLDILGISCDSFVESVNLKIGRCAGNVAQQVYILHNVREWCSTHDILFKLNTVVNKFNWEEDMTEDILKLNPHRWKIFQCNSVDGENMGETALRNAQPFLISNAQFQAFIKRHSKVKCLVPETEDIMQRSYLIMDERMRFYDKVANYFGPSLLDVGVAEAMKTSKFDEQKFLERGGKYQWSKSQTVNVSDW